MSENYIVINGKKAELTEEQLKALGINVEKDPFERVGVGEVYYYLNTFGEVASLKEVHAKTDDRLFLSGNYCADRSLLEQRAMHETLNRLLWQFSCENGELKNPWDNFSEHFYISRCGGEYEVYRHWSTKVEGAIYFPSEEIAIGAIKGIVEPFMREHPDFVW